MVHSSWSICVCFRIDKLPSLSQILHKAGNSQYNSKASCIKIFPDFCSALTRTFQILNYSCLSLRAYIGSIFSRQQKEISQHSHSIIIFSRLLDVMDNGVLISYSALKEHDIRLIRLKGGTIGSLIECTLEIVDPTTKPSYEALYYEWGDLELFQPGSKLNGYHVNIQNNLWWALHHLRKENVDRVLWGDALFINQGYVLERNHQVARTGKVIRSLQWLLFGLVGRRNQMATPFSMKLKKLSSFS